MTKLLFYIDKLSPSFFCSRFQNQISKYCETETTSFFDPNPPTLTSSSSSFMSDFTIADILTGPWYSRFGNRKPTRTPSRILSSSSFTLLQSPYIVVAFIKLAAPLPGLHNYTNWVSIPHPCILQVLLIQEFSQIQSKLHVSSLFQLLSWQPNFSFVSHCFTTWFSIVNPSTYLYRGCFVLLCNPAVVKWWEEVIKSFG